MTHCLLILDDDPAVSATIRTMAERFGFEVHCASGAEQFFETYRRIEPSHCLLDLVLPGVDGMQVIDELAATGCHAEIILTSGAGGRVLDAAQRAAREYGLTVAGILPKPFAWPALKHLLGAASGQRNGAVSHGDAGVTQVFAPVTREDLAEAIANKQIQPVYQPKIRCSDRQVIAFEALARWSHPTMGPIAPVQFIALAEAHGLIDDITREISEAALRFFAERGELDGLGIAINLSGSSLTDSDLPDRLFQLCKLVGLDPTRVILEITETSALADPLVTLSQATRLRIKGFELSIDDFGVGYSSFVQLARLPFSELKIDMSFVQTLCTSRESHKIVKAIIELGHSLGLRVTAEGVEDFDTLDLLARMRCDKAQGFCIARPMAGPEAVLWTEKYRLS